MYVCVYIYIYICVCVYICARVCVWMGVCLCIPHILLYSNVLFFQIFQFRLFMLEYLHGIVNYMIPTVYNNIFYHFSSVFCQEVVQPPLDTVATVGSDITLTCETTNDSGGPAAFAWERFVSRHWAYLIFITSLNIHIRPNINKILIPNTCFRIPFCNKNGNNDIHV